MRRHATESTESVTMTTRSTGGNQRASAGRIGSRPMDSGRKIARRVTLWSAAVAMFMGTWGAIGLESSTDMSSQASLGSGAPAGPDRASAGSGSAVVSGRRSGQAQSPPSSSHASGGSSGSSRSSRPAPVARSRAS